MATHLTGRDRGVSLRRLPRSAKLSVARGAGSPRRTSGIRWQQEKWSVDRGGRRGPQQRPQWECAAARHSRVAY
jgi:hypothetical protein